MCCCDGANVVVVAVGNVVVSSKRMLYATLVELSALGHQVRAATMRRGIVV